MLLTFREFANQTGYIVTVGKSAKVQPVAVPDDEFDFGGHDNDTAQSVQYQRLGPFENINHAIKAFQQHLNHIQTESITHISLSYYSPHTKKDLVYWNYTSDRDKVKFNDKLQPNDRQMAQKIQTVLRVPSTQNRPQPKPQNNIDTSIYTADTTTWKS